MRHTIKLDRRAALIVLDTPMGVMVDHVIDGQQVPFATLDPHTAGALAAALAIAAERVEFMSAAQTIIGRIQAAQPAGVTS